MDKSNRKRARQLGMRFGTACARLRKSVMFWLAQKAGKDICFRCEKKITKLKDFSIDHISPWLDSKNPIKEFFDLKNISFSHLKCNTRLARKHNKKYFTPEQKLDAKRKRTAKYMRDHYTTAKRREKHKRTGW